MKIRQVQASEEGAFLPIMAIVAVVVVAFLGMPVDTGMLATTANQYKHAAEYAAVAAMESYVGQTNPDFSQRMDGSTARANQILNATENLPSSLGSTFFKNAQTDPFELGKNTESTNGKVISGRWDRATASFAPVASGVEANAIKVELAPREASPLRTLFMHVLGIESNTFRVSGLHTQSPIHVVAIADLSHTVTYDNYWKTDVSTADIPAPTGPIAHSEFALRVATATPPFTAALTTTTEMGYTALETYSGLGAIPGGAVRIVQPPDYRAGFESAIPISKHYQDDYTQASLRSVNFDTGTEHYVFNTKVIPDPLASVTSAIFQAQSLMQSRNIEGDLMAIVGADERIHSIRVMGDLTATPSVMIPPRATNAEFTAFRNALSPYTPLSGDTVAAYSSRVASIGFFPRTRNFNLPRSLDAARRLLEDNRDPDAKEVVMLFTTGMTNCRGVAGVPDCRVKDLAHIQNSMADALAIVDDPSWLDPMGTGRPISLNVFMTGTAEGSSTLVKRYSAKDEADNMNHCMPDWIARQVNTSFVNPAYSSSDPYFFGSNQLYNFARATNALYFPMRTCCSLNGCRCATTADINAAVNFQQRCLAAGSDLALVTSTGNAEMDKFLDASRLLCDPFGRRKEQQARQAVSDIIGTPTIMLVQEGSSMP